MRRDTAAAGSLFFLVLAPGMVAGLLPWLLTGWRMRGGFGHLLPLRLVGLALLLAGVGALVWAFGQFVVEGVGTPAPPVPTQRLVVGGLYRYLRNPMDVAVLATLVGQVLLLAQPWLLGYAVAVAAAFALFVRHYEEPTLTRRYGAEYLAYRAAVPGWWPRLRPYHPDRP